MIRPGSYSSNISLQSFNLTAREGPDPVSLVVGGGVSGVVILSSGGSARIVIGRTAPGCSRTSFGSPPTLTSEQAIPDGIVPDAVPRTRMSGITSSAVRWFCHRARPFVRSSV